MQDQSFRNVVRNCKIIFISAILVAQIAEGANGQNRQYLPVIGVDMVGQKATENVNVIVERALPRMAMPAAREKVGDYVPPPGFIAENINELAIQLRPLIIEYANDITSANDVEKVLAQNTSVEYSDSPVIETITPIDEIDPIHLYRINRFYQLEAKGQNVLENRLNEYPDNPILATVLPQMFSYSMLVLLLELSGHEGIRYNMAYHVDVLVDNNSPHAYNISRALNILYDDGYWEKDKVDFVAKQTIESAKKWLGEHAPGIRELEKIIDR